MDKNVENDMLKKLNEVHSFLFGGGKGVFEKQFAKANHQCSPLLKRGKSSAVFATLTARKKQVFA